ncbi:MAG: T9SS type A sorting domain-containing protein [Flavobacteriales bacterium]|nr:T9SS type A sorting domain-containing protein [Flavobacteriales bacterium]
MKHFAALLALLGAPLLTVAQLTGTKTIGGANPDYATITAAVTALMNQGASGNVTFNIRPGTYTGQYDLTAISGTPGFITFKSETNDADDVILEYEAAGSTDNFLFRLDGTDGVVFQALTFRPTDTWFARVLHFFNDCAIVSIQQCVFEGSTEPNQNSGFERNIIHCDQNVIGTVDNPQDVMISDNIFRNGYAAMELDFEGFGGARSQGLIITDNVFEDQYATCITVYNAIGQIGDNLIRTTQGIWYTGIRTNFFDGGSQIRRNRIEAYATTGGCTGIECGNTQSTTGNMISNNMIYCSAPGDVWGLAVYNLWDMKVVHNSVLVAEGNQFQSYAFYHLSNFADGQDALVRNNIFANNAGGLAYNVNVAGNVATEDHNCLFTTGSTLSSVAGNTYATAAAHQAGTGQGTGDTDVDPVFPVQPDLHLANCVSDLNGAYYFVVAADIDGDARGNPVCDMGADEYNGVGVIAAPAITVPVDDLPYALGLNATFSNYNWSTGATTPTTLITSGGTYTCDVLDANGCLYTVSITVNIDFSTSVSGTPANEVLLFPIPAMEVLTATGLQAGVRYEVFDAQGRIVLEGTAAPITLIDVRTLRPGMHLLRWADVVGVRTVHFVKQ